MDEWNDGKGIDIESWIATRGDFQKAIGYSVIFWPEFIEYDGCVLKRNFSKWSYDGFMKQCKGDKTRVEAVMNHFHIKDIHYFTDSNTREQLIYLGNILKEIYRYKLKVQFPRKQFEVKFENGYKEELLDYELTFYQKRR